MFYFFKQMSSNEMLISDGISDVCSSDRGEDELAARIGCERLRIRPRPVAYGGIPETDRGGRAVCEQHVERQKNGHRALGVAVTPEPMNRIWPDDDTVSLRALQRVRCRHQRSDVERPGRHSRRCRAYEIGRAHV